MELLFTHVVEAFILPPGFFFLLVLLGVILRQRFYRTGQSLIYVAISLLLLMSLPIISNPLVHLYERIPALDASTLTHTQAKAIVVLGGGRYPDAPEYGGDTVSEPSLERIRYGAWLQRKCQLPILVTGGTVFGDNRLAEAQLMQQVLEHDFLAAVPWVEKESRTTYENAIYSKKMLAKDGINHIILVTHAMHMPRAIEAFEKAGFTVTPAPMGYDTSGGAPMFLSLLPNIYSLVSLNDLMHELIGRLWYHLRYY
jgi:uncharacterized SAM-binding protein YcdF (DUF218 family)